MQRCPIDGEYEVCTPMNGYVYVKGRVSTTPASATGNVRSTTPDPRPLVQARKTKAGAVLALVRRLKTHEEKGVAYSIINSYFRTEFKNGGDSSPMGMFTDILTYDPKTDPPKSYADVYTSIDRFSEALDWLSLWDLIDGLSYD